MKYMTKKNMRISKKKTRGKRKQRGGTVLRGLTGYVNKVNAHTIIKKISKNRVGNEEKAANILKIIDPGQEHTIYGTNFEEKGANVFITMKYGGIALENFTLSAHALKYYRNKMKMHNIENIHFFKPQLDTIKDAFIQLKGFLQKMHAAGITHSDMSPGNLVWDGERLRFIDWGEACFLQNDDNTLNMEFMNEVKSDITGFDDVFNDFIYFAEYVKGQNI
jgi:serine/threonine protein kinase